MNKSIGIMGTGWGAFLAQTIREIDPYRDIHLFGRDMERTTRLGRKINAKSVFRSAEHMLEDRTISGLVVALPHCLHQPVALRAADQSKAVFLEKPVALTTEGGIEILHAARQSGTVLHVGENIPFRADIQEAQKMIRAGQIGTPVYMLCSSMHRLAVRGWRTRIAQMGGGILIDSGIHHVRAIRMLMGPPSQARARVVAKLVPEMSGCDTVILDLQGEGWSAESRLSWGVESGQLPEFLIMGSEGSLHLWPGRRFLTWYPRNPRGVRGLLQRKLPVRLSSRLFNTSQRVCVRLPGNDLLGYKQELRAFLSSQDQNHCSYDDALEAVADLKIVEEASRHFRGPVPKCPETSIDRCLYDCSALVGGQPC
jgi:predicted dehydrogenase